MKSSLSDKISSRYKILFNQAKASSLWMIFDKIYLTTDNFAMWLWTFMILCGIGIIALFVYAYHLIWHRPYSDGLGYYYRVIAFCCIILLILSVAVLGTLNGVAVNPNDNITINDISNEGIPQDNVEPIVAPASEPPTQTRSSSPTSPATKPQTTSTPAQTQTPVQASEQQPTKAQIDNSTQQTSIQVIPDTPKGDFEPTPPTQAPMIAPKGDFGQESAPAGDW